jgi:hypothetical protein
VRKYRSCWRVKVRPEARAIGSSWCFDEVKEV